MASRSRQNTWSWGRAQQALWLDLLITYSKEQWLINILGPSFLAKASLNIPRVKKGEFRLIFFRSKPCGWCIKLWDQPKPCYSAAKTSLHFPNSWLVSVKAILHFLGTGDCQCGKQSYKEPTLSTANQVTGHRRVTETSHSVFCHRMATRMDCQETEGKMPGSWLQMQLSRQGICVVAQNIHKEKFYIPDG